MRTILKPILAAVALTSFAVPGFSETVAAPGQEDWVAAKKYIQINDAVETAYVEWGDLSAEPVILVHGYSDNSRAFSPIAPYLTDKHYIAIDMRGHGDSSEPECCYYVSDFAEDISDFIEAMGYDKAIVAGHSLGSLAGAVLAATHPEQVKKLALISTALRVPSGPGQWMYDTITTADYPMDVNGEFMQMWDAVPDSVDKDFMSRLALEEAAMPKRAWVGIVKALEMLDWTDAARHIDMPTLILWGDQDGFFSEADEDALQAALPEAQFNRYDGLGHSMYWEEPERLAKDLTAFFD